MIFKQIRICVHIRTKLVQQCIPAFCLTFGGMWRWRRVAVARVFALVVRCRDMMLIPYSRVGKNRDTMRESPAGAAGAACTANEGLSCRPQYSRGAEANCIYRPVSGWHYSSISLFMFPINSGLCLQNNLFPLIHMESLSPIFQSAKSAQ